jgi:hypothetical protein
LPVYARTGDPQQFALPGDIDPWIVALHILTAGFAFAVLRFPLLFFSPSPAHT